MATRIREKALSRAKNAETRAFATVKYVRMSPSKVRITLDTIRGKKVEEALAILANQTTAAAEVETPDATTVAPEATTAANGGNSSTSNDDVPTGAAAAPFAALALAAGAAFVAFKARKK